MLTFLLGPDDFSKDEYTGKLAAKTQGEAVVYLDLVPKVEDLTQQSLFGGKKMHVLKGLFSKVEWDEKDWNRVIESPQNVMFIEESLDQRTKKAKQLLANEKVEVKSFELPAGKELETWIIKRVKDLGGEIDAKAAALLAEKMGRDLGLETKIGGKVIARKEIFNLWQVDSEIKKLLYSDESKKIVVQAVQELSSENMEVDVFKITNAAADGNKAELLNLLDQFLNASQETETKGKVIQLTALLSQQFRDVLMIQDFLARNVPEGEVLGQTGWKSGRLFVISKIARKMDYKKTRELLVKLESLDMELKTSSTPPEVLLDLILSQL